MICTFRIIFLTLLSLSFLSVSAHAKKVSLEWKEIKHAIKYELKVNKDRKAATKETLTETSWSGELGFGLYDYQIRAIDKLGRPGQWSNPAPLVVMPASPEPVSPSDGDKLTFYDPKANAHFSWKEVPGIRSYKFTLFEGKKVIQEKLVNTNAIDLPGIPSGEYTWKVSAVIENAQMPGRSIASTKKAWTSKASDKSSLIVSQEKLKTPVIIFPVAPIYANKSRKFKLQWNKVEGAESYTVKIRATGGRAIASVANLNTDTVLNVKDNNAEISLPQDGNYKWEVQAEANKDDKGVVGATSSSSVANFKIVPKSKDRDGKGYVKVSALMSTFALEQNSPVAGRNSLGTTDVESMGIRLSGEYFFANHFGLGASWSSQGIQVNGQNYELKNIELTGRYRIQLGGGSSGYFLYPKIGLEQRDYLMLLPYSNSFSSTQTATQSSLQEFDIGTLGPQVGISVLKQFSESWGISAQFQYYYPLWMTGGSNGVTNVYSGWKTSRNFSLGTQGMYWLNPKFGLGAGVFLDMRSLAFGRNSTGTNPGSTSTPSSASNPETVTMDAKYIYLSLTYSFGN